MRYLNEANPRKFYSPGYRKRASKHNKLQLYTLLGTIAFMVLAFAGIGVYHTVTVTNATCTVTSKDRTSDPDGNSDMRVYTSDCGTFVVQDLITRGIVNSADIYGSLEEGKTYNLTYSGHRVPLLSMFPTIQKAELVN